MPPGVVRGPLRERGASLRADEVMDRDEERRKRGAVPALALRESQSGEADVPQYQREREDCVQRPPT